MAVINFITGNQNKLTEINRILGSNFPVKLKAHKLDLLEYQGDAEFIATEKCKLARKLLNTDESILIEDTCLEMNALNCLPGPYVKYFLEKIGPDGLYKILSSYEDKSATAMCILAYDDGTRDCPNINLFIGRVKGKIVEPRGENGFGWDRCFQPENHQVTFSEMNSADKDQCSHRFLAVEKFSNYVLTKSN